MKLREILLIVVAVVVSTVVNRVFFNTAQEDTQVNQAQAQYVNNEYWKEVMIAQGNQPVSFVKAAYVGTRAVVRILASPASSSLFGKPQFESSQGSGVIISDDGYIVTNHHVIASHSKFSVETYDRRKIPATLVGSDPMTDIALLKVDGKDMGYLTLADSDSVMIGEWVLAIGNPYHLSSTVTAGIVSAKGRSIDLIKGTFNIESFIQTDAVVNSGNSGGALVNQQGQLIGLNTAIFTQSGSFEGYSFAIPSNILRKVVSDLKDFGKVQRGIMGVGIESMTADLAAELGLDPDQGVYVNRVFENSAAKLAGLMVGDVITSLNGKMVNTYQTLQEQAAMYRPGDKVRITYIRKKKTFTTDIVLISPLSQTDIAIRADQPLKELGLELRELGQNESRNIKQGVVVHSILKGSKIAATKMEPGFIIQAVNGVNVANVDAVINQLAANSHTPSFLGVYKYTPGTVMYQVSLTPEGM